MHPELIYSLVCVPNVSMAVLIFVRKCFPVNIKWR